jgi:alcohol dehydrogenase class IV
VLPFTNEEIFMVISSFRFPTSIKFGPGVSELAAGTLLQAGCKRPLLVTDRALAPLAVTKQVLALLSKQGLEPSVYADAEGNPCVSQVMKGVEAFRQAGADSIVMLGGGCALDVGKAIGLMVHHPGHLFAYEDDMPDALPIDKPLPLMIALPTTAGTGSEVGGSTVISHDDTHQKVIVWSTRLVPAAVFADPCLTISLPATATAATGIDALTHNIEAFLAKNFHPLCDGIALEGVRIVADNLPRVMSNPEDIEARGNMMLASMMGGTAFQKGLGVTHSCAHALSTCFDVHHGLANWLMLLPSLAFNLEVVPERFVRLGRAIGLSGSDQVIIGGFFNWLKSLRKICPLPYNLEQMKITPNERLVEVAVKDACHANNPRPCREEDFRRLFAQAVTNDIAI